MTDEETKEERQRLIIEIMGLAYLVQSNTDHAVFIDYSGHVDQLSIKIVESPDRWNEEIASSQFYTQRREKFGHEAMGGLKAKKDHLVSILEGCGVDTSMMEETVSYVYEYSF